MFLPNIIEKTGRSSKAFDLPTKLLEDRIVYLFGEVNEMSANVVIMQLLWLQSDDPTADINLYINSPGGSVSQGLAIFDVIKRISCKVNTICVGQACSMGAFLLSAGTGVRKASQNSRIMMHSVGGGYGGQYHDMKVDFKELEYFQNKMIDYISSFTNGKLSVDELKEKTERDYYISPEEAIEMGLIDEIL